MKKVLEGLCIRELSASKLTEANITHMITASSQAELSMEGVVYLRLSTEYSHCQHLIHCIAEGLEFIHKARADGGTVLIECMDSGVALLIAYLMLVTDLETSAALGALSCVYSDVTLRSDTFQQLEEWSRRERWKWKAVKCQWRNVLHNDTERCHQLISLLSPNDNTDYFPNQHPNTTLPSPAVQTIISGADPLVTTRYVCMDRSKNSKTLPSESKKAPSRMEKLRTALHNALSSKPKRKEPASSVSPKHFKWNRKKKSEDVGKENKSFAVTPTECSVPDGVKPYPSFDNQASSCSHSLPSPRYYRGYHSPTAQPYAITLLRQNSMPRLLPGYKTPITADATLKVTRSPAHRSRTVSQSSCASQYSAGQRVTSTHIPDHIDRRLFRSRSVGVLPDSERRLHRTASARVITITECEDWDV